MTIALKKPYLGLAGDVVHASCECNQALEKPLDATERSLMKFAAAQKIGELFDVLGIDYLNDHNTRDTPSRVAKMYIDEILRGRFTEPPTLTEFENVGRCDHLIVTGPIDLRSMCAHHLMPIYGSAYIGVLPAADGKIIGLSKYDRIVDYFAARLQIQEELVKQIATFIVERTKPRGLAVRISAVHMCKSQRGVRASHASRMVTTEFYGDMLTDKTTRSEFLQECALLDRNS